MMKPAMRLIQSRSEILTYVSRGKNDKWIAREAYHGRELIREVRRGLDSPSNRFALKNSLGAPRKVNDDLISKVVQLTRRNPRLPCTHVVDVPSTDDDCELSDGLDAAEEPGALRQRG